MDTKQPIHFERLIAVSVLFVFILPWILSLSLFCSAHIGHSIGIILKMILIVWRKIVEPTKKVFPYFICWVCAIPIIIVLLPSFGMLYLYKAALNSVVLLLHPNWKPLTFLDTLYSLEDPYKSNGPYNFSIGYVMELEGVVDLSEVHANFLNRVFNVRKLMNPNEYQFERLRKYPIPFYGHYYWSDDIPDLKITDLIKERVVERTDLKEFLEQWTHSTYRAGTPLWEAVLYKDNDEYRGKTVIMFKMSHSVGDGETVKNILNGVNGICSPRDKYDSPQRRKKFNLRESFFLLLTGPHQVYRYIQTIWTGMIAYDPMSEYPKSDTVSTVRGKMRLKDIKRIRAAYDCKFSDVLLNAMGYMIKGYMLESLPENQLPESTRISQIIMIPSEDKMGNQITAVSVQVPIKCSDAEERLRKLSKNSKTELQKQKGDLAPLHKMGLGILGTIPSFLLPYPTFGKNGPCCGITVIDNVISVDEVFGRYPILLSYPISGMTFKRTGFIIYFTTLRNELVEFTLQANKAMVSRKGDLDRLVKYFQEGVADMLSLIEEKENKHYE